MRELPVLNPARCIGCGDCVTICPTECIALAGDTPWLPKPRQCITCTACVLVCPVDALAMRPLPVV